MRWGRTFECVKWADHSLTCWAVWITDDVLRGSNAIRYPLSRLDMIQEGEVY